MPLIFLILCLVGCGERKSGREPIQPDFTVNEYVARFEKDFHVEVGALPIGLGTLPEPVQGRCTQYPTGDKEVIVDSDYFNKASDIQREQLIYHELLHCVLGKVHNNHYLNNGYPESIMNEYLFNDRELKYYSKNKPYYINEALTTN